MPSPTCQIKEGAGSYQPQLNGFDATPAATVTINLLSSAGVSTWSIQCITTDELSDAAAVTAALVIDSVAKTATFTAPVAGRAYRFQSQINGGIGPDGTVQSSYTTTFCVYTLTGGRRCRAVDETFEGDSVFGWVGEFNDLLRSPPGSTFSTLTIQDATQTDDFIVQGAELAADRTVTLPALAGNDTFVFEAHPQTLTNKTLTLPKVTSGAFTYDFAVSAIAASRTVTLPLLTGNDTFVFAAHTQTLTNKTLTSPTLVTPQILDSGADHSYIFAPSNLAANRNITLPLLTGNDTFVFEAHTQTLTNKTLTAPAITGGSFAYLTVGGSLAANRNVTLPVLTGNDTYVFEAHTQTLTNKTLTAPTLTSPVFGGTPQYTATRGSIKSVVAEVQTSSTSQTTCGSYTMTDETLCAFDIIVTCARRTNVTKGGRYKRSVVYRRTSAGAPTIVGVLEAGVDQETTAADDVTIDVSSNDVRVRVTAADADPRNWFVEIRVQETLAT